MRIRWTAVILIILLLTSCSPNPGAKITYDEITGYNFVELLNQEKDSVLKMLKMSKIETDKERDIENAVVYTIPGRLFGNASQKSTLMFSTYGDSGEMKLYRYYEIAEIAWWPSESEEMGEKVIRLYEKLKDTYGEPGFCSPQIGESGIIGKPVNRQIEWNLPEDDLNISIQISGDKDSFHFMITYSSIEGEKTQRERLNTAL